MVQRRRLAIILCVGIFLFLVVASVSANPTPRTRSIQLLFENDALPYNESVNYSMICYGYFAYPTDHYEFLYNKTKNNPNPPMKVFTLTGICPSYGCHVSLSTRSPPEKYWEPESSTLCELSGTTAGQSFVSWNITGSTGIQCAKWSDQWDIEKKDGKVSHYYRYTSDYYICKKKIEGLREQCLEDLVKMNSKNIDTFISYDRCIQQYNHQALLCESNLQETTISEMNPAQYSCTFRFDIPNGNLSSERLSDATMLSNAQPPVESLYCGILSIFGMRC